jgi:hypothetical protein
MNDRYLTQLPPKSSKVAPGDVVGGLIYIMDKPVGVEPGMIGISIDSPSYREYVLSQLKLLERNKHPHKQLQSRFNHYVKKTPGYSELSQEAKIDLLLQDKKHLQHRYPMTKADAKKIFLSFGKYHEVKAWQTFYENIGTGGLLFHEYEKKLKTSKKDHFASHIQKFIDNGNPVYMVKQDGKMVFGRTGPDVKRLLKTEIGKKMQAPANASLAIATGGTSALLAAAGLLGWRAMILKQNTPTNANSAAIIEDVATKLANIRGFSSQDIQTIQGTYANGTPKIATIVTWSPGCGDLTGKLSGGEKDKTNVIVSWDKNGAHLKVDKDGNILRTKKSEIAGKEVIGYEKILEDGSVEDVNKEVYEAGLAVSEHRIAGLGESLISFISMGDRDGIGEVGQNKVILELKPPHGNHLYQFFGIDFGKAYEGKNPIIDSLADDFSIINPSNRKSRFLNISILYDTSLRDKMKGVYLLAVLRNKLSDEEKERIAIEYEEGGDKSFADKLRAYPDSLFDKYGENIGMELTGTDAEKLMEKQKIQRWIKNGDLWWIKKEENKYRELASKASNKKRQKHYSQYADKLSHVYNLAKDADNKVLAVFSNRLHLSPKQIDLLENVEKLTAHKIHVTSPDGKVQLNHLRVEREDRVPWQLTQENGKFTLHCKATKNLDEIKNRLALLEDPELLSKIKIDNKNLRIEDLTQLELDKLGEQLSEERVASKRSISGFRTQSMRQSFENRLLLNKALEAEKAKSVDPMPEKTHVPKKTEPRKLNNKAKRSKAVTPSFANKQVPSVQDTVLNQHACSTTYLQNHILENQQQYTHLKVSTEAPGSINIDICEDEKALPIRAQVNDDITNKTVSYSLNQNISIENFEMACRHICQLAIATAAPFAQFDISVAPSENRAFIQKALDEAIAKAIQENRFDETTKPILVGRVQAIEASVGARNRMEK